MDDELKVDDLYYDWPPDVIHFSTRTFFGLTINELIVIALPAVGLALIVNIFVGAAALVISFFAIRKFEVFGNRALPFYIVARLAHIRSEKQAVIIPSIYPNSSNTSISLQTWEGEQVVRLEDV